MFMRKYLFLSLFTCLSIILIQVDAASVEQSSEKSKDSQYLQHSRTTEETLKDRSYPLYRLHNSQYYPERSVWKATVLSATMPGLGQAYADNYMKATLFLASEIGIFSYASYHIARSLHYRNHDKFNTGFYDERTDMFLSRDQVKVRSSDHAIKGSIFIVVGIGIHVWNIIDASKTTEEYNNRRMSFQMQLTNHGTHSFVFTQRF